MPEDPYEFTQLLVATDMKSLERNSMLEKLAKFNNSRKIIAGKQNSTRTISEPFFILPASDPTSVPSERLSNRFSVFASFPTSSSL